MRCSKSAKQLTLFSLNCRSVKNKALSVADLVTSRDIDILVMPETWLGTSNTLADCECSQKDLFRVTKNLMVHKGEVILPSYSSDIDF